MSIPTFINVTVYASINHNRKSIAIDNVASIEPYLGDHTRIVLKEVKDGNNVEVLCVESYGDIAVKINAFL